MANNYLYNGVDLVHHFELLSRHVSIPDDVDKTSFQMFYSYANSIPDDRYEAFLEDTFQHEDFFRGHRHQFLIKNKVSNSYFNSHVGRLSLSAFKNVVTMLNSHHLNEIRYLHLTLSDENIFKYINKLSCRKCLIRHVTFEEEFFDRMKPQADIHQIDEWKMLRSTDTEVLKEVIDRNTSAVCHIIHCKSIEALQYFLDKCLNKRTECRFNVGEALKSFFNNQHITADMISRVYNEYGTKSSVIRLAIATHKNTPVEILNDLYKTTSDNSIKYFINKHTSCSEEIRRDYNVIQILDA